MRGRLLVSAVCLAACVTPATSVTLSSYRSAASRSQTVSAPPLLSVGASTSPSVDGDTFSITGLSPGSSQDYLLNIRSDGSSTVNIATTARTSSSTSLDTDATNGLHVEVDRCSTLWQQSATGASATCNGTSSVTFASTAMATANAASATTATSGFSALSAGGVDHLRIHFSLPSAAPASYSTLTSSPTVTIWGQGPPGSPTGVTTTPGDGQVAVSWTAPASAGNSTITGYTVSASPSGASCTTTTATSCTLTGLTDGMTQSITVSAIDSLGTGSPSTAVSGTPYPATLFTSANGLSLWLDAADSSTLFSASACSGAVSSGGAIGCIKDKSSVGENFTQSTSANQPVLGTLNGLGAVDFTSISQLLQSINSTDTYQTVFIAAQPLTTSSGWDYVFGVPGSDFDIRTTGAGGQFSTPNSGDWAYNTGAPALDWSNGRQATDPTLGSTSVITAQSASVETYSASVSNSALSRGMLGYVGEVIAFNTTLTTAQRRTVEDYLARKWGPTITPDPPGTPTATVGSASASVSWAAPAYNGGSAVTGYTVTSSPGSLTCTTTGTTSCTVTGLTVGTAYTFTVTATNSVGTGASSSASSAVTPIAVPGAPTRLGYTAASTALTLSWLAPASNGGSTITAYTATATPGGATCSVSTTSCTISGLTTGTTYSVSVTATNAAGTGPASTAVNAKPGTSPPGAPTALSATPGDGQVTVSWTAPASAGSSAITGYSASASPSGASCTTTTATSCTLTGISDGSTQSISASAINAAGTGPPSTAVSGTPYPATLFTSANGLSLWLDAADSSTVFSASGCTGAVSAGGAIGCIKDKSTVGENFTQATSGNQPVLGTLNGLGALDFTSVSQLLQSVNSSDTYQTVFIVADPQSTSSGWETYFGQTGQDFNIRTYPGSGRFSSPNNGDWAYNTGTPALDWSNGRQATDPAVGSTSVITAQSASGETISASVSNSVYSRGMLGYVGEVIAFSASLTTSQRRTVEDYLAHKWGATITPDPTGTPTATAGTKSAAVSWSAPAYNGGSAVTGYTVTSSPGALTCTTTGATSCTVSGLTSGTAYTFTVTATNTIGTSASSSASSSITAG